MKYEIKVLIKNNKYSNTHEFENIRHFVIALNNLTNIGLRVSSFERLE